MQRGHATVVSRALYSIFQKRVGLVICFCLLFCLFVLWVLSSAALSSHWKEAQHTEPMHLACLAQVRMAGASPPHGHSRGPIEARCEEPASGQGLRVLSHVRIFMPPDHPSGGRIQGQGRQAGACIKEMKFGMKMRWMNWGVSDWKSVIVVDWTLWVREKGDHNDPPDFYVG